MPYDVILAGSLVLSVLLFALAGGADFGGGVWSLLARRGERAQEQQQLVERAIAPIWEVNELWIIVAVVILWTAFTPAFAAFGMALFIPFVLAIAGILLRGAFLAFRIEAQEDAPRLHKVFGEVFGNMSVLTPVFLGMAAGAIASGRLQVNENLLPVDGYFRPWLGLFPITVGVLGLVVCTYLAAIYLTLDAADNPPLQEDFRIRGMISGGVLGALGLVALPITRSGAPICGTGSRKAPVSPSWPRRRCSWPPRSPCSTCGVSGGRGPPPSSTLSLSLPPGAPPSTPTSSSTA